MTTTNLSNEYLEKVISLSREFLEAEDVKGGKADLQLWLDEIWPKPVMQMARELLALREAAEKPVGSYHIVDQDVEATTDYVKPGEWPIDNGELLLYAAPQLPVEPVIQSYKLPDGWMLLPNSLSAENGAKACLSGEFVETKFISCPECLGDDDCESCDGSGLIKVEVPVSWTTIKAIWTKSVEHFTTAQPPADADSATSKAGEPKK